MSFRKHHLEVEVLDAPEFPENLPSGADVNVPFPAENHPEWTVYPCAGAIRVETFDNHIMDLPDPLVEPAYYATSVDTIRFTEHLFALLYPKLMNLKLASTEDITAKLVKRNFLDWRTENDNTTDFPRPPDLRTLFVRDLRGLPTDNTLATDWTIACKRFKALSSANRYRYLQFTRDQIIKKNPLDDDDNLLAQEVFMRYLAWRNHVLAMPQDRQPTRAELEAFFDTDEVKEKGATLVQIYHAFPYARDTKMLVHRIERFATLEPQPPVKTVLGKDDPVESRYMRNPVPSREVITGTVEGHLSEPGSSIPFPDLLDTYWPNAGNHQFIADVLVTVAQPDLTSHEFILKSQDQPDAEEIYSVMEDHVNGYTFEDIAARFLNRLWDPDHLGNSLDAVAYYDRNEERFFPLYEQAAEGSESDSEDSHTFLEAEESMRQRNLVRINLTWDPLRIDSEYRWDPATREYVKRSEPLDLSSIIEIETEPIEPWSPTEVATSYGSAQAPPPEQPAQITLQTGVVAAIEIAPIEPWSPTEVATSQGGSQAELPAQITLQTGVVAAMEIAPIHRPQQPLLAGEPSEQSAPAGRNKRRAEESIEPAGAKKKGRASSGKIRCSQNTKKGTRCKRTKDRAGGEEEWDCGVHNRG